MFTINRLLILREYLILWYNCFAFNCEKIKWWMPDFYHDTYSYIHFKSEK